MSVQAHSRRAVGERLAAASGPVLLAVVVATSGSTYRKPGALVLIEADGRQTGVLSGGCLEADFRHAAQQALEADCPAWLDYDSLDDADLLFGSGTGCRGRSRILLWPLRPGSPALGQWQQVLAVDGAGGWLKVRSTAVVPEPHIGTGPAVLAGPDEILLAFKPPPRIWIIGAGPELPPLLHWLHAAGWHVTVSEHRLAWRAAQDLAPADRVLDGRPDAVAAAVLPAAVVLAMSHSAQIDLQVLRRVAATGADQVAAIGLLGPPRRRDELLAQLSRAEVDALTSRLVAPVGLPLGGEGPLAIALAIAAWLQQGFPETR